MKLNRTSEEIESYSYWEYETLIKDYVEYVEKKNEEKEGNFKII